jgi:hypothetical protein
MYFYGGWEAEMSLLDDLVPPAQNLILILAEVLRQPGSEFLRCVVYP